MRKRDPISLSLIEPEPVTIDIETDKGERRTIKLRPFSLRDEKWLNVSFDNADLSQKLIEQNDLSDLLKVFVHQLIDDDRAWLAAQYGVPENELSEALYARLPADQNAESNPAVAIISAVFRARSSSYPELIESEIKKKMRPRLYIHLMKWLLLFATGWVVAYLTLI